ncbi:hypothetical protein PMES_00937 [Profundibacterium mesophilum KAUST100406-0324]|uniref:Uncharacterized protein n=2 Tax=Profundibacterium TaxID=1258570 RepID=A0A921TDC5_9RHOB|nr:hypothetical protein PMES_00937 [Profundibacterium mesophilum KAUST100406-0324]
MAPDRDSPTVEALHPELCQCLLTDGRIVPITDWLDEEGEECGYEEAVIAIAGQDGVGWWRIGLSTFSAPRLH